MKTAYSQETWYQVVNSMIDSLTRIGMTTLVGSLGAKLGMAPKNAALMGQASYAMSMYGRAFDEAVKTGSSFDDAHTYAWGIALTETLTENIGGFIPGVNAIEDLMGKKTWTQLLSTALSEGGEEVLADLMGTGLDIEIDRPSNEDFWAGVGMSFLAGALTGIVGSAGQNIMFRDVIDNILPEINKQLKKQVKSGKEGEFFGKLNKQIQGVVKLLNNEKTRMVEQDEKGRQKIRSFTDGKAKVSWLRRSGLDLFIDAKYNEDGTVEFSLSEKGKNLGVGSLNPTIEGKAIKKSDYAISQNIYGVEMKNADFSPVELKNTERKRT